MRKDKSYSEKLRDPRWQRLRLKTLESDGWACVDCQDSSSELHVHHLFYAKDREPWEYKIEELVTLCSECHDLREKAMLILKMSLRYQSGVDIHSVAIAASYGAALSDILEPSIQEMQASVEQSRG